MLTGPGADVFGFQVDRVTWTAEPEPSPGKAGGGYQLQLRLLIDTDLFETREVDVPFRRPEVWDDLFSACGVDLSCPLEAIPSRLLGRSGWLLRLEDGGLKFLDPPEGEA